MPKYKNITLRKQNNMKIQIANVINILTIVNAKQIAII